MPERQAPPDETTAGEQVASADEPTVETAQGFARPGGPPPGPVQGAPGRGRPAPAPRPRPGPGGPSGPASGPLPAPPRPAPSATPAPRDPDGRAVVVAPAVPAPGAPAPAGSASESESGDDATVPTERDAAAPLQNGAPRSAEPAGAQNGTPTPAADGPTVPEPVPEVADAPDTEPEAGQPAPADAGTDAGTDATTDATVEEQAADAEATPATPRPAGPTAEQTVVLARADVDGSANAWFEPWADDPTQAMPVTDEGAADDRPTRPSVVPGPPDQAPISQAMASADPVTERLPVPPKPQEDQLPPDGPPPPDDVRAGSEPPRRRGRKLALAVGALVVLAGLSYGADLLLGQGSVPRGVTTAGVAVGGLDLATAEQRLHAEIDPRADRPVQVRLGEATTTIDPGAAGLAVDWPATMAAVGEQPLNPITRIASLFGSREVDVVTAVDAAKLDSALAELAPTVNRPAAEGTVRFTGTTPIAVDPLPGQELDVPAAAGVLRREWVSGAEVRLPLASIPPMSTAEGVAKAVDLVARPAVASPFTVTGEAGTSLTLTPEQIASVLAFKPGPGGELIGEVNPAALEEVAGRSFAASEQPGRDASIDFATGAPVVVPSQDGRGVDYEATAVAMGPPLISADRRQVAAVYAEKPAELTTEKLKELGITGLVSEFTTRGFAADSGQNIKRAAEQINGTVVQPGATFSLNGLTNPRDASNGYVEAGIIEDGHPSRGIGGGVSQIATTTYNAAYFAGMTLVEHREHSFYISRYPPAREATVFDNIIDLKFRNDSPTAIMIQTVWTPSTITVRFFGTKYYEVTSTTGPRTAPTEPKTVTIPSGEPCSPSSGAPGFTVTDTRTLRDLKTGAVRSDPTRTVRYNPSPIVECGG